MSSTLRKALIGAGIAIAVVGLVFGGLTLYRNLSRKPVNVYPLDQLAMQGWYDYSTTTYGTVSSEGLQKVFLGERQTVLEVLVSPGDEVHVGDPLLRLDTTLSGLDVKKAEIAVGKLELQIQQAQSQLATLRSLRPHSRRLVIPESNVTYTPHETPYIIIGQGLKGDPFIILWDESDNFSFAYLNQLIAQYQAAAASHPTQPGPADEGGEPTEVPIEDDGALWVTLITRQDNALNAPILSRTGLRVTISGSSASGFSFYDPVIPADIAGYEQIPQPYYEESGSWYTAAELVALRSAKEQEIKKLTIQAGLARVELEKKKAETTDGFVRATIDGIVTAVTDPDQALSSGRPVVSVSAGGGYYITGYMGEFDLMEATIGQQVQVTVYDWSSKGGQYIYTGTISKISTFPTDEQRYYGGNTAVSSYPFTVFVDGSADISDNSYVEISYGAQTVDDDTFYIPNAFIRTEGGRSFVYVMGEDGRLEERVITPGRDLWGNYTEIRAGLSMTDLIAFPYGKDVVPGAKTEVQDDLMALYQGMYY